MTHEAAAPSALCHVDFKRMLKMGYLDASQQLGYAGTINHQAELNLSIPSGLFSGQSQ